MDLELKPLDHIKLTHHLCQSFACGYSEDDRVFIINDSGIYILSLNGSVTFEFPLLALKKHFFCVSNYNPGPNIDLDINSFHSYLPKNDLYETFESTEYIANLKHVNPVEASPLSAEWSPQGLVAGINCFLAVLTDQYSLEIYEKFLDENENSQYRMIFNITQAIIDEEKNKWTNAVRFPMNTKLEEYKKRVGSVTPKAFTWSHLVKIGEKSACIVFIGLLNGDITAWAILETNADPNISSYPLFLGRYQTGLRDITTIYWHRIDEYEGELIFANIEGKINIIHISKLNEDKVQFNQEQLLWTEADKEPVSKITVMVYENKTYIIVAKQRVLIIFGFNDRKTVFDCQYVYLDDLFVTGIHHHKNNIFVLSLTGNLIQLTLTVQKNVISLEKYIMPLKFDAVKYRTHGFFFSKNMVMCGVLAHPLELQSFSKSKTYVNVFIYHNSLMNPLERLWNNESGSLRHFWDCFEVLRLVCLKEKHFPWLGLPSDLNYDTLSLPKLKTLRWLAKLSEMVFRKVPVVKNYNMKAYILLHYLVEIKHAVNRMRRLLSLMSSGKKLSEFQMRSIFIQNMFLKEMVVKDILAKANVGKTFIEDIMSVMGIAGEIRYPEPMDCVWCGKKIVGLTCLPPHVDSRCSISMMPIVIVPTYKCPNCKALAHKEIEKEQNEILCLYCDIPMEMIIRKEDDEELTDAVSDCYKDCLNENIDFNDIENYSNEDAIFTVSDDDDDENQRERLKELYKKCSNLSLEEIMKNEEL